MMATRKRLVVSTAILLAIGLVAGAAVLVRQMFHGPTTITAYFPTATAIYPGDEVRVSGVRVGTIESITPEGTQTKMVLKVDRDVPIPADAKAVIVAQNLVAARYVQLAPAYRNGDGPTMADGAVIPSDRTAVPVEWDEVKTQLLRLADELGPQAGVSDTSMSRFIDSAANAIGGNGEKLRETLRQLSGVARIFAEGSGNITDIIKNLQVFVSALRDSKEQIVLFENRLATLTSVINDNRTDLDAALTHLSTAINEVQRFVEGSRDKTTEQVRRLTALTQILVDHKLAFENVLHITPNAIANFQNIFYPNSGAVTGAFSLVNFNNPVQMICGMIGAVANVTAAETAKLCAQYLGPALRLLNVNNIPMPINAYLRPAVSPDKIIYADPKLAPGGSGPDDPPEPPPTVSAYTGAGDVPPPPGWGAPPGPRGIYMTDDDAPAIPSPALFPGAPIPGPPNIMSNVPAQQPQTVEGLLLPQTPAPAAPADPNAPLLPAEGAPPA
ncbi:virulence factor Mce family protein [Mycolicibacterium phlei]|jgi:phospholipid/cholesterol/gamma-HCH transport system substrate-binding protein|uniref:Mammalian cell entry protein n=1 Tax=Mycolicibacterium phlei DSM 43239 = CCUG 21000 TaxID=1226750 RepID=A0A5N5UNM1_MYCPH|nr:MCE family protein [Mycolicibacterium phlei]VEG10609.1 virulence factor Mce family protein [Mycobacteroides chelonae]AMO62508.1 mce related protein [Mycolicibacterium phlei]KAB7750948.1 mammalian cell entry protein [Mycolicibacterium phlei DSM 43239 = CCUG 21000]KXW61578.1 mammalian cell entry protein [Mycolicibacterium phlei DSM 43239 = CCUG 21000]KXW77624.1 mammalian cell entry protein [Mycolicibacterium phlei DSM 43071]